MKFFAIAFSALLLLGCIDEYSDSFELRPDGSAAFFAAIYPCEPDSSILSGIKADYESIAGLKFDSAWFSLRDSAYSLNFKVSFENLLAWQGHEKIEKDFIGSISLKKTDSNIYSFERIINASAESEEGHIVPEESVSSFILEQISKSDSSFWEYAVVLPKGAALISSEPVDVAFAAGNEPNVLRWKIPVADAVSKRIAFKADYSLQGAAEGQLTKASLISIIAGCILMLLAIALLIRKLKKLSAALRELKNAEKDFKGE
jgi:hypothetical protein